MAFSFTVWFQPAAFRFVDGSASSWGIALRFHSFSLSLASSSSFLGFGRDCAEPGDASGGEKVARVCAVDRGQGSCCPQQAPGGVARLGLTRFLGSLLHGGLGRGQGPRLCSTRDSWCFATGRQGGSIHSQLTTPGDPVLRRRWTHPSRRPPGWTPRDMGHPASPVPGLGIGGQYARWVSAALQRQGWVAGEAS